MIISNKANYNMPLHIAVRTISRPVDQAEIGPQDYQAIVLSGSHNLEVLKGKPATSCHLALQELLHTSCENVAGLYERGELRELKGSRMTNGHGSQS